MLKFNSPVYLRNGLEIIIKSAPKLHSVGAAICVKYGASDDRPGKSGLANLLQETVYKVDAHLEDEIDKNGMESGPFTDYDATTFALVAPRGKIRNACDILAALVSSYKITDKVMDATKAGVIEDNKQMEDDAGYFAFNKLRKMIFGRNRVGTIISGTNSDLENISAGDLKTAILSNYTPNKMVLAIYGSVSYESALNAAAESFSDMNQSESKTRAVKEIPETPVRSLRVKRDGITQTKFSIGLRTRGYDGGERMYELAGLECALGTLNERMFDEVREKRGLVYVATGQNSKASNFGFVAINAGSKPEKMEEANSVILEELQKMKDGEVSVSDLNRAKTTELIDEEGILDDTMGSASKLANGRCLYGDVFMLRKAMAGLSLDQLRAAAEKYLNPSKAYLFSVEPKSY